MTWLSPLNRLVLMELLVNGRVKQRRSQAEAFDTLAELPWTRMTTRRGEIALVEQRRGELVALIGRVWPEWGEVLTELTARGLPPTPEGWARLEQARRVEGLPELPARLNRRTAAALAAPHSKAQLTASRMAALGDTSVTRDGSIRLRPPAGLQARTARGTLDLEVIAEVLGEVAIPERALRDGLGLVGPIRAILLVENLGAFCDLPELEGWLFAYVPGWDTATVEQLLLGLAEVPVVHFGDLDPNGVRIHQHLEAVRPDLRWFVPAFWEELVDSKGQLGEWPDDLDLRAAPALVHRLVEQGRWLEQEAVVLDGRLGLALEAMLA